MEDRSEIVIDGGISLALPPDTRSTLTRVEDQPDVRRFFPEGPAVYAVSVAESTGSPEDAVGLAAGDIVYAYRRSENFSRTTRTAPQIPGAVFAMLLDFVWDDRNGVRMHSLVLVAGQPNRTVVVHGALPELQGPGALEEMEATLLSCRLTDQPVG